MEPPQVLPSDLLPDRAVELVDTKAAGAERVSGDDGQHGGALPIFI